MWRNNVDPKKINLGLGFYGRSFQLSDPSCWQPGCLFLGGASPGPCTANSGTLSYREIMQVIEQNKLTPYYDQTNAVKYIVWNNDQWVSYDDKDTFKVSLKAPFFGLNHAGHTLTHESKKSTSQTASD
jgi:chitinase